MKRLFTICIFISFYFLFYGQGYGIIKVSFENNIENYLKFDTIYDTELQNKIVDYLEKKTIYPQNSLFYCEEGTVLIGFNIKVYVIDTSSVKIITGINNNLDNEALRAIKNMPKFSKPSDYWKSTNNKNILKFAISFNYKVFDCNDSNRRDKSDSITNETYDNGTLK